MFSEIYKDILLEYEKFWERKNNKRCILNLSYRKDDAKGFRKHNSLEEKWFSEQFIYERHKAFSCDAGYLAEGLPMHFTNFGPGCVAACVGGNFKLGEDTIWFETDPIVNDLENLPEIKFDENSDLWKALSRVQDRFSQDPNVNYSITDLGGIMDIVASLRGTGNLLFDLYDHPSEVIELSKKVKKAWFEAFDRQVEMTNKNSQPFNTWMGIPSKTPWFPLQSDFSYMISPSQFEQFVLCDIIDQVNYMDRSIYHLDGVGQINHIDMLLDIENLTGIQWVPGVGQAPLTDKVWFDLYKKIQDKGKNLVLLGGISQNDLEGAERLIKTIDPKGTYISVFCTNYDKAQDLFEKVSRWSE